MGGAKLESQVFFENYYWNTTIGFRFGGVEL